MPNRQDGLVLAYHNLLDSGNEHGPFSLYTLAGVEQKLARIGGSGINIIIIVVVCRRGDALLLCTTTCFDARQPFSWQEKAL